MGFNAGGLSVRLFYVPFEIDPEEVIGKFQDAALGSIDWIRDEVITGWVGPRHLLDRSFDYESACSGGYLRLTLCSAQRKIPASLLKAECQMEEQVWMKAEGREYVNRQTRGEIKKEVIEKLLPDMPLTLKGIDFCYDRNAGIVYASALSEKQLDAFMVGFNAVTGVRLVPVDPASAALRDSRVAVEQWPSWGLGAHQWDNCAPGREFLMWLWFISEAKGGEVDIPDVGRVALLVEGPLVFEQSEQGEANIRKGEPMVSAETRAALLSGKKLRRAKVTIARGEELFTFTLDADEFIFRTLKLPKTEAYDSLGKFIERMELLETFRQAFLWLYSTFVALRNNPASCTHVLTAEMKEWISSRPARNLAEQAEPAPIKAGA